MNLSLSKPRLRLVVASVCALLAAVAYAPAQLLPFISDDYVQIDLARKYGPLNGWAALAADALYRCRATSLLITHWTEVAFGLRPFAFKFTSLVVHVLNTWLVMGLGIWKPLGYRIAYVAAIFFAFIEGHQEAVIWYAALPELLVFTFSLISFLLWVRWLQGSSPGKAFYLGAFGAFLLALASKESAVCITGLFALSVALERSRTRRHWYAIVPFALVSVGYFVSIYAARTQHLHFNDGTFSLHAPFWFTLINSSARLFWFWGVLAIAVLVWRAASRAQFIILTAGWVVITLLPYSFLTYMPRVPSRHTYFASVALALVLAAATLAMWRFSVIRRKGVRVAVAAMVLACLLQNTIYLWTRKQKQFQERADVTQQILRRLGETEGPLHICFAHDPQLALLAVSIERPGEERRLVLTGGEACNDEAP